MACSNPPGVVYYSNDLPVRTMKAQVPPRTKIVMDQSSLSTTILCSTKSVSTVKYVGTGSFFTKRVLKSTSSYVELRAFVTSQQQQTTSTPTDGWLCSEAELQALGAFLDTYSYWQQYGRSRLQPTATAVTQVDFFSNSIDLKSSWPFIP